MDQFNYYYDFIKMYYKYPFYLENKVVNTNIIQVLDNKIINNSTQKTNELNLILNYNNHDYYLHIIGLGFDGKFYVNMNKNKLKKFFKRDIDTKCCTELFCTDVINAYKHINIINPDIDLNFLANLFIDEFKQYNDILNNYVQIEKVVEEKKIKNSKGLVLKYIEYRYFLTVTVLVETNGVYNSAKLHTTFGKIEHLNIKKIVKDLVEEANRVYDKIRLTKQKYDILFSAKAVSNFVPFFIYYLLNNSPQLLKKINQLTGIEFVSDTTLNFYNSSKIFDDRLKPVTRFNFFDPNIDFKTDLNNFGIFEITSSSTSSYTPPFFKILGSNNNFDNFYSGNNTYIHVLDFDFDHLFMHYDTFNFCFHLRGIVVENGNIVGITSFVIKDSIVNLLNKIGIVFNDAEVYADKVIKIPTYTPSILFKDVRCYDLLELEREPYFYGGYMQ